MVRGCEKRIYHVKNTESEIFDEAYFVLRRKGNSRAATPREIELEAKRIVMAAAGNKGDSVGKAKNVRLRAFLAGAALSAAVIGVASTVIYIVI